MDDETTYSIYSEELGRQVELSDLDAYAVAVRSGFIGSRQQWLASLAAKASYLHTQTTAGSVWTVTHNLSFDPAGIVVLDQDGQILDGWTLQYLQPGVSLRLGFDIPSAGTARLT